MSTRPGCSPVGRAVFLQQNPIVTLDPDEMMDSQPLEVYSAADLQEAHLIKNVLENAGIEARVVGDHLQGAVGDLPALGIAPRVWVNAGKFDQARKIIVDHQASCQSSATPTIGWKCSDCGEPNEPSFEICWSCQSERVVQ